MGHLRLIHRRRRPFVFEGQHVAYEELWTKKIDSSIEKSDCLSERSIPRRRSSICYQEVQLQTGGRTPPLPADTCNGYIDEDAALQHALVASDLEELALRLCATGRQGASTVGCPSPTTTGGGSAAVPEDPAAGPSEPVGALVSVEVTGACTRSGTATGHSVAVSPPVFITIND